MVREHVRKFVNAVHRRKIAAMKWISEFPRPRGPNRSPNNAAVHNIGPTIQNVHASINQANREIAKLNPVIRKPLPNIPVNTNILSERKRHMNSILAAIAAEGAKANLAKVNLAKAQSKFVTLQNKAARGNLTVANYRTISNLSTLLKNV